MKTFDLVGLAAHLARLPLVIAVEQHEAMEEATKIVQEESRHEIGTYQSAVGPFAAWAPLADTTLQGWGGHPGKIALGYAPPDNPLLREGDLRESIERKVEQGLLIGDTEGVVGSNSDIAVFQELGTTKMPPRSFLGGAAARKSEEVARILGEAAVLGLAGAGKHVRIR